MKKILPFVLLFILIFAIKNTAASLYELSAGEKRFGELQKKLDNEQTENKFLKQKLLYVKTDTFIENQARNKLGLVKDGEYIVLVPKTDQKQLQASKVSDPNWKLWLKLLL